MLMVIFIQVLLCVQAMRKQEHIFELMGFSLKDSSEPSVSGVYVAGCHVTCHVASVCGVLFWMLFSQRSAHHLSVLEQLLNPRGSAKAHVIQASLRDTVRFTQYTLICAFEDLEVENLPVKPRGTLINS